MIEIKRQRSPAPREGAPGDDAVELSIQAGDNAALEQIRKRDYSAKYRGLPNQGLFKVGLVFDSRARNLVKADWLAVSG